MNENAKTWVAALRSGDYKQGTGSLAFLGYSDDDNSDERVMMHCCLGVACELYQKEVGDLKIVDDPVSGSRTYDGEPALLPAKVSDWLRITPDGMYYPHSDDHTLGEQLTARNDTGSTFEQIADIIEREPSLFS